MALKFDGKSLERIRKALGLTRAELATKADLGRNTIRDLEQEKAVPNSSTLTKLVSALGCKFEALHTVGAIPDALEKTEPHIQDFGGEAEESPDAA